jgi:hypothetical protein
MERAPVWSSPCVALGYRRTIGSISDGSLFWTADARAPRAMPGAESNYDTGRI